jgi:hypothetical protein
MSPCYSSSALLSGFDRPWSVVTRDSFTPGLALGHDGGTGANPSTMTGLCPSAIGYEAESEPFAKAAVRVVHRSCEALPETHHYFGGSPARWLRSCARWVGGRYGGYGYGYAATQALRKGGGEGTRDTCKDERER